MVIVQRLADALLKRGVHILHSQRSGRAGGQGLHHPFRMDGGGAGIFLIKGAAQPEKDFLIEGTQAGFRRRLCAMIDFFRDVFERVLSHEKTIMEPFWVVNPAQCFSLARHIRNDGAFRRFLGV